MYCRICKCGAYIDPGEICEDCRDAEKAAPGAGTSDGGMENKSTIILAQTGQEVKSLPGIPKLQKN